MNSGARERPLAHGIRVVLFLDLIRLRRAVNRARISP
jgi:hypothetical protein